MGQRKRRNKKKTVKKTKNYHTATTFLSRKFITSERCLVKTRIYFCIVEERTGNILEKIPSEYTFEYYVYSKGRINILGTINDIKEKLLKFDKIKDYIYDVDKVVVSKFLIRRSTITYEVPSPVTINVDKNYKRASKLKKILEQSEEKA